MSKKHGVVRYIHIGDIVFSLEKRRGEETHLIKRETLTRNIPQTILHRSTVLRNTHLGTRIEEPEKGYKPTRQLETSNS